MKHVQLLQSALSNMMLRSDSWRLKIARLVEPPLAGAALVRARAPRLAFGAARCPRAPISGQQGPFPRGALTAAYFSTACFSDGSRAASEPSTFSEEKEALKVPLAFVNRYAEALDVLMPNLANHECLRRGSDVKFDTPLAAQPPGTGKTALGRNITAILRRPREASAAVEASVAERLRNPWRRFRTSFDG